MGRRRKRGGRGEGGRRSTRKMPRNKIKRWNNVANS